MEFGETESQHLSLSASCSEMTSPLTLPLCPSELQPHLLSLTKPCPPQAFLCQVLYSSNAQWLPIPHCSLSEPQGSFGILRGHLAPAVCCPMSVRAGDGEGAELWCRGGGLLQSTSPSPSFPTYLHGTLLSHCPSRLVTVKHPLYCVQEASQESVL